MMSCDDSLLSDFLDESSQLMERLNEDMLRLDELVSAAGQACDADLLNTLFRSAHSIKGLSAMLGFGEINTLVHRVENVFDSARGGRLAITRDVIDVVFGSLDCLAQLLDGVRRGDEESSHDAKPTLSAIDHVLQRANCAREQVSQADAERELAELRVTAAPEAAPQATPSQADAAVSSTPSAAEFDALTDETAIAERYLTMFVDETECSLDRLTEALMQGEAEASDAVADDLLITAHRIKGSAASLGLRRVARLAHRMEDMLQQQRERGGPLKTRSVDALLISIDALRNYTQSLRRGQPDTSTFAPAAQGLDEAAQAHARETAVLPAWAQALAQRVADGSREQPQFAGRVQFLPQQPLSAMKAMLLHEKLSSCGHLLLCEPEVEQLEQLDEIDTLSFVMESFETPAALRARLMIAGVQQAEVVSLAFPTYNVQSPAATASSAAATGAPERHSPGCGKPAVVAAVSLEPTTPAKASSPAVAARPTATAAVAATTPAEAGAATASGAAAPEKNGSRESDTRAAETIRVDVERLDQLMNLSGQLVINKARLTRIGDRLRSMVPARHGGPSLDQLGLLMRRLHATHAEQPAVPGHDRMGDMLRQAEQLFNQVLEEQHELLALRTEMDDFGDCLNQLDRVTGGIQKCVMDTRMVAIGPLFHRFKRVIRDMTRSSGKDIQLVIQGDHTELDKRMIDELGDPLVHMVRNSADHGIESPDRREQRGKPRSGTITLNAFQRGSRVVIEVSDDGQGLDTQRILAKAIEKQIVTQADAAKLTPAQIHALIWEPGFSTAEKITEISGRGMGMDIVRAKIEGIKGTVQIESTPGVGTKFIIVLPLTMAILPSLLIRIEGSVFALPLESVREITTYDERRVASIHGSPSLRVRDRVISLVRLEELFSWSHPGSREGVDPAERAVVVLEYEGQEVGLVADHLLGEEDIVIESIDDIYGEIQGVAGASVLGDGRVSLILDIGAMLHRMKHAPTESRA